MKTKMIVLLNDHETMQRGAELARLSAGGLVIFLEGELGAGKTTFTRGFLQALGFTGKVKSPTYTLVEPYDFTDKTVYHFDLYRIEDPKELLQIGIEEYFTDSSICIIEWPEKGLPLLPRPDITCYIEMSGTNRKLYIKAHSERGEKLLKQIKE